MLYLCRSNTLCRQGFMQQNLCVGGTGTEKKRDRNKTMIFDTHAHYDDEAFEEDRGALIASLAEQGIGRVVNVAADLASVSTSLTLATVSVYLCGGRRSSVQRAGADGAGLRMAGRKTGGSQSGCCRGNRTGLLLGQRARGAGTSAGKLFQTASACKKAG